MDTFNPHSQNNATALPLYGVGLYVVIGNGRLSKTAKHPMQAKVPGSFYVHISSEQPNQLLIKTDGPMVNNWQRNMSKIVENIIAQPEEGYEGRYGSVVVVVRDTETGRVATASVQWNTIKSKGEATAEATKDAMDKL